MRQEEENNTKGGKMRERRFVFILATMMVLGIVGLCVIPAVASQDVPRIMKEDLKKLLDKSEVLIIDVRSGRDWTASEFKIKGAIRENPHDLDSWANKYKKDKTLVLYCA